jgi:hypothetical protein
MIKYTLKCADGHAFESWFASASAFDTLALGGHLACMQCGSSEVKKAIMTPRVSTKKTFQTAPKEDVPVGSGFAREARDMHLGNVPERPIWGEANAKEAKALIDDGVPVAALPFLPTRKVN